jgi:hypothetical protein
MELLALEVVSLIAAFVAFAFFMLGRWSAFRTIHRSLRGKNLRGQNIASQISSLTSTVIETAAEGSDSDFQKFANSVRHREKYKKSKPSD